VDSKFGTKPDYGVDAPKVMRNLFVFGALAILLILVTPGGGVLRLGSLTFFSHPMLAWTGGFLLAEGFLFLLYVKYGKFRHRDFMLATGHGTGIDIWSNVDMGGNSADVTLHNLQLENIQSRCTLVSAGAQQMPFEDATFDVIVSNLCLHNLYDKPTRQRAVAEIARVLKPGGVALLSDYKRTGEYASQLRELGFDVKLRWGSFLTTFPPLRIVIAHKPL